MSDKANAEPVEGSIFSFQTAPFSEYSPRDTGRYAVLKILGSGADVVTVAVLDGIWTTPPAFSAVDASALLKEQRFGPPGRPAAFGVSSSWWDTNDLREVVLLGLVALSADEREIAKKIESHAPGSRYSPLNYANTLAEGEWRWNHDRDAFSTEIEKIKAKSDAEYAARKERYRTRLQHLTWDQLLAETTFSAWSPSPPFPPEEFITAARDVIRTACRDLEALGQRPRKAAVRAVLKRCVTWFNDADSRFGGVIETEEREDICAVLEEMAVVARQGSLVEEIDAWRTW